MKRFSKYWAVLILGVILIVHGLILTKLIYFPYPELFIYPYLTNNGLKPYSQILDQHFPGLMFLPINFDNLGMTTPEIARIWSIVTVLIIHIMLFFISKDVLKSKRKALFVNFLYLIWQPFFEGWVLWIDSFLPLILLPAFYTVYKKKFFASGLLLGLGIIFKQVLIPLSLFILVYFFWNERKNAFKYLLGLLLPVTLMIVYFLTAGIIKDFIYWTVIFNLTVYAKYGRGTIPTLAHFTRVALVFGLSFLIAKKIKVFEVQILLIFLVGTLIGLSTRFDFVHFQPALPFALLGTVYGLNFFSKYWKWGILIVYLLITAWWLNIFYKGHIGERVYLFDKQTQKLALKVKQYTEPKEKIFVFGGVPHLYQLTQTLPAGDVFVFQFPWFLQVSGDRILEGIIKDKPEIIVADKTTEIEEQKLIDFAKNINQYINQNYQKIDNVGKAEILRKKS